MLRTLGGEQGVSRVRGARGLWGGWGLAGQRVRGGEAGAGPGQGAGGERGPGPGPKWDPLWESFQPSMSPRSAHVWFGGDAASLLSPSRDSGGVW